MLLEHPELSLSKGITYELDFSARATKARNMEITLENAQYTRYFDQTVSLSDNMENYHFEFKMAADDMASLKFLMGKLSDSTLGTHDIFIDNVSLKVKNAEQNPDPTPTLTPELDNGRFDDGMAAWNAWWGDQWSGVANGITNVVNGVLVVDMTSIGGASYSPQIFQKGILFEKGKTYKVSFDAKADIARKVNVNIGKELTADPWFTNYAPTQEIGLSTDMQTYQFEFTMNEATYNDGKLVFELGNVAGENIVTTVYLDNVSIQEKVETPQEPTETPGLDNGSFDDVMLPWQAWWGDQWSGVC